MRSFIHLMVGKMYLGFVLALLHLNLSKWSLQVTKQHLQVLSHNTFWGVKQYVLCVYALGTQAPLGAGFGNPLASAVGTSLGSSTLGGTTSALNITFCFALSLFTTFFLAFIAAQT